MNRIFFVSASLCATTLLGACTTLGIGSGTDETTPRAAPVAFNWASKDGGVTGTMSATLPDGRTFTGPYFEITQTTESLQLEPMWTSWNVGWPDWEYGLGGPWSFDGQATTYTGKVVANLQGPDAQHMRCRFDLAQPLSGMGGGGQGKCQVAGGDTIDAVFPRG